MMLSAAPHFEDVFLHRCLGQGPRMAYAELDAAGPDADSVSQWFDLSGWRGFIAAPEGDAAVWRAARPNAAILGDDAQHSWTDAAPLGFIRFAKPRDDAAAIVTAAQPLIVLSPSLDAFGLDGIQGYSCIHDSTGMKWFGRADVAADFAAHFSRPLARDEFTVAERQAAALARMLSLSEAAAAQLRIDHDRTHQQIAVLDREIQGRDRGIEARDREIQTRDQDIQTRDREIQARDRGIETRDREIQARDQEIQGRDREIEALNHEIQARDRVIGARDQEIAISHQEIAKLRPEAERLARLVLALDWPDGPRALRAVLPLARVVRRLSHKSSSS